MFGPHPIGAERFATVSSGTSFAQVAGAILHEPVRVQNPDKDQLRAVHRRRELVGGMRSAGIDNHRPLLRLGGSDGAVATDGTVGRPALPTAVTVAGVAVGAFGPADV